MSRRLAPLLVSIGLVACGQEGGGIGQTSSAALEPQVRQVRAAASSGDRVAAERTLDTLRQTVADLRQSGALTESAAAKVLAGAAEVEAALASMAPATTTPPPTVAPTVPVQPGPEETTRTTRRPKPDKDDD